MSRTELFARKQSGGMFTVVNNSLTTGDIYFVSSGTGTDSVGYGRNPDAPFATLNYAVTQTTASKGDRIYVMPGHVETIVAAAGVTVGTAGIEIIGLGTGHLRPRFDFTTLISASFDITAANVKISNVVFNPTGIDAITAAINVTGADVTFDNCEMQVCTANKGVVLGILTAATATRFRVENCLFFGPASNSGTACTAIIKHEVGIDYVIRNNYFTAKCTQAILNVTTILGGLIDNNRFVIATGTVAITMAAASTPFISNNVINVPSGTTPIVAAAGFVGGNVYSAAAGVTAGTAKTI